MTRQNETSLHLRPPRGHAMRDLAFLGMLLAVIAAFVAHAVRF
jgi:hypothetical protein